MARKKPADVNKSEDDKEKSVPGSRTSRVLRPLNTTKGEGSADEKARGKKPMVQKGGNLTIRDGDGSSKIAGTPAKRKRNSSEDEKEKSIVIGSGRALRSCSAKQAGTVADEKAKGKGKLVAEVGNAEKPKTPAKSKINASDSEKGKSIVIGSTGRVLRASSAKKGGRIADEKAKGKGKLVAEEGNAEKPKTPAKSKRNASEAEKGKGIVLGSTERVLRASSAKKGGVEENARGKKKLVAVEGKAEKLKISKKGRNEDKEIAESSTAKRKTAKSVAESSTANVETRKNPPRKGRPKP